MAFNRPGNSRDDKSGRSSNRTSKGGDRPKRSASTGANFSKGSDQTKSTRPSKKYSSDNGGERHSFSEGGFDKPASSFSGGEKKSFTPKSRPYSGRPSDNAGGAGKSFTKSRPYSGRTADSSDRPAESFGGEKKPFSSRSKSSSSSFNSDDRPKRSFDGERTGDKKSFTSRSKPSTGSYNSDEKPKRSFGGDRKYTPGPAAGRSFKSTTNKPYNPDRAPRTWDNDGEAKPLKTMRSRKPKEGGADDGLIRLNRYISNAGICSRRKADELISAGVVSVNGVVVSELGHKVDPMKDEIKYNGETLKREKMVYVLLNKPKDYITTTEDPQERRTVMHLVEKASRERIYPVGRLDRNTTGLLLMTNDGDLADKLSHPRNNIVKLYQVELNKSLTQGDLNKIGFGVELEDGFIKPDSVSYVSGGSKREIGIQIHSGKNRIVRRIFEHLGYEVVKLDRAVYANLTKKDLPRGRWRFLEEKEVIQLKHLV